MQLWDSAIEEKSQVLLIGASNRPQDLDAAVQRRFQQSHLIALPDGKARKDIIKILLADIEKQDNFDFAVCADLTEGFASSDLVALCSAATAAPYREWKASSTSKTTKMRALQISVGEYAMHMLFQIRNLN